MFGPSGRKRIQVSFRLKLLRSMHRINHEVSTSSGLQKAGILPILNDGSLFPDAAPLARFIDLPGHEVGDEDKREIEPMGLTLLVGLPRNIPGTDTVGIHCGPLAGLGKRHGENRPGGRSSRLLWRVCLRKIRHLFSAFMYGGSNSCFHCVDRRLVWPLTKTHRWLRQTRPVQIGC